MRAKKIIITCLALAAIIVALWSVWNWQKKAEMQPLRQEKEIR